MSGAIKAGTRIYVSDDAAELWLGDYNVRVCSDGVVLHDTAPHDKKVLVSLDYIDGESNVCVLIRKSRIKQRKENQNESLQ